MSFSDTLAKKMFKESQEPGQRSEALLTTLILTLSGGAQDAYSYIIRGGVFANAQTGNIVLLAANAVSGNLAAVPRYLIPLASFSLGILVAELVRLGFKNARKIHWRQLTTSAEAILLFIAAFVPEDRGSMANALISFSCAMQVQAFRKVRGQAYASTMCIGNMRSAMDNCAKLFFFKERKYLDRTCGYLLIILTFCIGAGAGAFLCRHAGRYAIWLSAALMASACLLMNRKPDADGGTTKAVE